MTRSVWSIPLLASACAASAAPARDQQFRIEVRAGPIAEGLATLSAQTGASIGATRIPNGQVTLAVRGRMDTGEALRRMLARSDLQAERVGPSAWRLVPRAPSAPAATSPSVVRASDVIVTGRKTTEALSGVPAPVAAYLPDAPGHRDGAPADAHDVARAVEGLSLTNLGPGRDRPFIRGIADSPFNGFSQATVSVVVDDARVTYDAPEPGLRLVDVARVEVLKGPQGPLYGTGALGGVYRVVTNRPMLGETAASATAGFGAVEAGGPQADMSAVVNAPLLGGAAAIRVVGYAVAESGWVRDAGGSDDVNDSLVLGARLAVRVVPATGWTVDGGAAEQRAAQRDSQYTDRDGEDLTRSARIPEPSRTAFKLLHGTVTGPIGGATLTVASSYAWQDRTEVFAASGSAAALGRPDARSYRDKRSHRIFDQEVRIASAAGGRVSWLAGASFFAATTLATGDLAGEGGAYSPYFLLHRGVSEAALFGDVSASPWAKLRLGLGTRLFRATTDDERREELGAPAATARAKLGVTPSASVTYEVAPERLVYLRFGTAFRPGGLDPANARTGRYGGDEVRSFDLGTRQSLAGGKLLLSGGAFRSTWTNVQSDYLQDNGLVATRNAGDALILGAELAVEWQPGAWWFRTGGVKQHARLERGVGGADLPEDRRLPVVPDLTARFEMGRTVAVAGAPGEVHAAADYLGRSRLSFDQGLDREEGGYATLRVGGSVALQRLLIRVEADNLLNSRADTFAFGNPFMVRVEREYTPLRPRSVRVAVTHRF